MFTAIKLCTYGYIFEHLQVNASILTGIGKCFSTKRYRKAFQYLQIQANASVLTGYR